MTKSFVQFRDEFAEREKQTPLATGRIYEFEGLGDGLVYNPSVPFEMALVEDGPTYRLMYVRAESTKSNWLDPTVPYDSRSVLVYEKRSGHWSPVTSNMNGTDAGLVFEATEDPFVAFVDGELVVGMVAMEFPADFTRQSKVSTDNTAHFDYTKAAVVVTTVFYAGKRPNSLKRVTLIRNMKDIRLAQLGNGQVLVATRPQGGRAGMGSIGFTRIDSVKDLTQATVDAAPLMLDLTETAVDVKLGVLDMSVFKLPNEDERVGVTAVVAYRRSEKVWRYLAAAFTLLNPSTFDAGTVAPNHTPMQVIAWRKNWKPGREKRPQTRDVVFPAGVVQVQGEFILVAGLSDGEVGDVSVPDPFVRK